MLYDAPPESPILDESSLAGCLQCLAARRAHLHEALPGIDDEEGERVADDLPPVIDAHVHLFEDPLFAALWRWFDAHGWPIRYKLPADEVAPFLLRRGVDRAVLLHYAHKPGIARGMNRFVAEVCAAEPRLLGAATVFPGEPHARVILEEAFAAGLRAVKLHTHVQCVAVDDERIAEIADACEAANAPLIVHAGREPKSPAYKCDPWELCSTERTASLLQNHPRLQVVVPHLGSDELDGYGALLERFDNLWLDTTMMLAGYFDAEPDELVRRFDGRILYGTDFPNLPYARDRELRRIPALGLDDDALARLLAGSARQLYGLDDDV